MEIIKIWNYIRGYVIINLEGLTLERFLNIASKEDIFLWDVRRIDKLQLSAKVSIQGMKELKKLEKKYGCKIYILDKKGLPFIYYKIKFRKAWLLGIALFIGIFVFLTSFIWTIEISGFDIVDIEEIKNVLSEENIKTGVMKNKVSDERIRNLLLRKFQDIASVNIDINGTNLLIEIKEKDIVIDEDVDKTVPCDIVASKRGLIQKIVVKNGTPMVEAGEIVNSGDLLISGYISSETSEEGLKVHSEGEITALIRYHEQKKTPLYKIIQEETGRVSKSYELKFSGKGFSFFSVDDKFDNYVEESVEKKLFNRWSLPIKFYVNTYRETQGIRYKEDKDIIKEENYNFLIKKVLDNILDDAIIIESSLNHEIIDEIIVTDLILDILEDIGKKIPLE